MRRFDKPAAGGVWHRWKCAKYDRGFICNGFDVENGKDPGAIAIRTRDRDEYCDPSATQMVAKTARLNVIARDGGLEGVTHSRAVAERIGAVGGEVTRSLPTAERLKRDAQNAGLRGRRKARMEGEGGFVANYNSLEEMAIPPNLTTRPGGDEFLLYGSGA